MSMRLPPLWATNTNYAAGPDIGTPTRVDPATEADGFARGVVAAPQYFNYMFDLSNAAGRYAFELAALRLRTLSRAGTTIDDAQDCVAALGLGEVTLLLTANTDGVLRAGDNDRYDFRGAFASIEIGAAADSGGLRVATDGTRIMAVGSKNGTTDTATDTSDDAGFTWTARTLFDNAFAQCEWLLWDDVNSVFVGTSGGTLQRKSADGTTWTTFVAGSPPRSENRLACPVAGPLIGVRNATPIAFASTADATTWAVTAGTVANAAQMTTIPDRGTVAGFFSAVYHVGRVTAGLQVSSTTDGGATWTTLATLTPADGGLTDFAATIPRILQCADTGLLIIAARANADNVTVLYASLDGADWVGPQRISALYDPDNLALANGRLFALLDGQVSASDGIGAV